MSTTQPSFQVNVVDVVKFCSTIPPCYKCGRHHECYVGGLYKKLGTEAHSLRIEPKLFRKWEDCPDTVADIEEAARKLKNAVRNVYSRTASK